MVPVLDMYKANVTSASSAAGVTIEAALASLVSIKTAPDVTVSQSSTALESLASLPTGSTHVVPVLAFNSLGWPSTAVINVTGTRPPSPHTLRDAAVTSSRPPPGAPQFHAKM